ncbi:MAG: spore germination protein [Desulforudis sp.]|nr:spore germination protein [Clostridia bacterium]MDQ7791555.1 spore germination protein [Clostridia bacterium]RJX19302.1 MAG: spore germination protein [Desulforudis sp.]
MSTIQKLSRLLLFREPQKPQLLFEAGEQEDRGDVPTDRRQRTREQRSQTGRLENLISNKVPLPGDLKQTRQMLERLFRSPGNADVVIRQFTIGTDPPFQAMIVFYDGLADKATQNYSILQPLMLLPALRPLPGKELVENLTDLIAESLLPGNEVTEVTTYQEVADNVMNGLTVVLVDGQEKALVVETRAWEHRGVQTPQVEAVIRGPQEAFTEQIRVNVTLVRKYLRRTSLVNEFIKVGEMSPAQCSIMYLDDIANPNLVAEVRRRLKSIKADYINESGILEQFIQDQNTPLAPQALSTERPDRVAASLVEGRVAILVDGNPWVLIVPTTLFSLMQAAEDAYIRWPAGTFARAVRYAGMALTMLLPGFYVSVVTYHPEFIPTDLLLAMTGARELVPFPTIVEVLMMELAFELIREAGIRIPGTVGTTLGIVGALILGQAAVAANIVSPILIVVVAVTALGSFAIPNYELSVSVRMLRFGYILLAVFLGLFGIVAGLFVHLALLAGMRSFGVPFLAPLAPVTMAAPDYLWRGPVWEQERRPDYVDPLRTRRQPRVSRGWTRRKQKEDGDGGA